MKALFVAALVLFGPLTFADGVCFYENEAYQGKSLCVPSNFSDPMPSNSGWSKRISSVKIEGTVDVTLFALPGMQGKKKTFNFSMPYLHNYGWSDVAQSYTTNQPAGRVCFFYDVNYGSGSFCIYPGQQIVDMTKYFTNLFNGENWNDKISSIRVDGDALVTSWEDVGFGGANFSTGTSIPIMPNGWNDKISSVRVTHANGR